MKRILSVQPEHRFLVRVMILMFAFFIIIVVGWFIIAIQDKNESGRSLASPTPSADGNQPGSLNANAGNINDTNLLVPLPAFTGSNSMIN